MGETSFREAIKALDEACELLGNLLIYDTVWESEKTKKIYEECWFQICDIRARLKHVLKRHLKA